MVKKKKDKYKRYIGKFPVNSRITVDYTGKKPKVKFGYPSKTSESTSRTLAVALPAILVAFIIILIISFTSKNLEIHSNPELCEIYTQHFGNETEIQSLRAECLIDDKLYNITMNFMSGEKVLWFYETQPSFYFSYDFKESLIRIFPIFLIIPLYFLLCKIFVLIYKHTKWGHKTFPELNKSLGGDAKYSAVFKECPKNKQIELPLFRNIYMDYEAKGEFGKYLQRVEIREHPFNELIHKGGLIKKRKIKKKKNIWLWKATFFFSKQPKKGQLEIRWT